MNVTPSYIYTLSSRSCTPQTRSCPSRLTAIIANRRYRCTSSGTVRKSSSRVKASRSQAQGRTLRLFGTDLMRDAITRRRSPRVILLSYPLYHNTIRRVSGVSADRCFPVHVILSIILIIYLIRNLTWKEFWFYNPLYFYLSVLSFIFTSFIFILYILLFYILYIYILSLRLIFARCISYWSRFILENTSICSHPRHSSHTNSSRCVSACDCLARWIADLSLARWRIIIFFFFTSNR